MSSIGAISGLKLLRWRSARKPSRWNVVGLAGAVLALMVQLTVPFAPMPLASGDSTALQQAAALWGSSAFCIDETGPKPAGKHAPLANNDCPFCQLLQQVATLLPPAPPPALPAIEARDRPQAVARLDAPAAFARSPAQPRAPPVLQRPIS